jgi:glycosyltransferase involved in cell wall biosynthesis
VRPRVLFIAPVPLAERMAGPGIRTVELARAVSTVADVELAGLRLDPGEPAAMDHVPYTHRDPSGLVPALERADAVFAAPVNPMISALLRRSGARLIFDLYGPEVLEWLELSKERPLAYRRLMAGMALDRLREALLAGHHFVCAGERQRDLWIGTSLGLGLVQPGPDHDADPALRDRVAVVPFGLPSRPPVGGGGIRRRFPQIPADAEIVLWNGGIWDWLDAGGAIRAAALLAPERPGLRLVFMGTGRHPADAGPVQAARELARELGVLDDVVLFNDGWVPYEERMHWLLDADCALSLHFPNLETRFAFRTRLLDCLWAGLPIVCTRGDELADLVERDGLGATVPPSDPRAVADALAQVLTAGRTRFGGALERAALPYGWDALAEPLRRAVTSPVLPERFGAARLAPPLGLAARGIAYRAARSTLNATGLTGWAGGRRPRL